MLTFRLRAKDLFGQRIQVFPSLFREFPFLLHRFIYKQVNEITKQAGKHSIDRTLCSGSSGHDSLIDLG